MYNFYVKYETYRFAGTDNRLTYLISFSAPDETDKGSDNKVYDNSLVIKDNVQIMYNVYNNELGVWDDRGRFKLKAEVSLEIR